MHKETLNKVLHLAVIALLLVVLGAACLQLSGPKRAERTASTPTVAPTGTPVAETTPEPTRTPTSTVTPTITATSTITPTPQATALPGLEFVPPFGPPLGGASGTPGAGGSSGLLPIPGLGSSPGAGSGFSPDALSFSCNGDERMIFLPSSPQVGQEIIITITSAQDHAYTFLLGPAGLQTLSLSGRGGPGFFWQWRVRPTVIGPNTFRFYSGPSQQSLCVTSELTVVGLSPTPTPTPTPTSTATPTATSTPRPDR